MGSNRMTLLAPDQIQVSRVNENACPLAEDEDGIEAVESIGEERQSPANGEEPERQRDDALFPPLGGDPLDHEAHGKERLPYQPDRQPQLLVAHHALLSRKF